MKIRKEKKKWGQKINLKKFWGCQLQEHGLIINYIKLSLKKYFEWSKLKQITELINL